MYPRNLPDPTPNEHLEAYKQPMFPQDFKDASEVCNVLGHHLTLHHHVVYVDLNAFAQLGFKYSCHHPLTG